MTGKAAQELARVLRDPGRFAEEVGGVRLRSYQLEVARAIVDSVLRGRGLTFAVMMSRQSGKNETAALIEAQLLTIFAHKGGQIVKAAPTFNPQVINSIVRLEGKLDNRLTKGRWHRVRGHMLRVGKAIISFYSSQLSASVVGGTASILLEADEAQDVPEEKWNKDFRPMGSSTNATTVLWGTAWTSDSLLSKTIQALKKLEAEDGIRRTFVVPWPVVAAEVPGYGIYVESEIARLGASHPIILTQYALQDVDSVSAMFPASRREMMQGEHSPEVAPQPGAAYAITIDVAGEDARQGESGPGDPGDRDLTALTIFRVVPDERLGGRSRFLVVQRLWWRGVAQVELYNRVLEVEQVWRPRRIVIDATGVGAGLASFLQERLGARVLPFVFTSATKSELGWAFLAMCDTGRFLDHASDGSLAQNEFRRQVAACSYELLPGPARRLRWGAKKQHDDLLISAALCGVLEREGMWGAGTFESFVVEQGDILSDPGWRSG